MAVLKFKGIVVPTVAYMFLSTLSYAQEIEVAPITVEGKKEITSEYSDNYLVKKSSVGLGFNQNIKDIPQSITTVSHQYIKDGNFSNSLDVIDNINGVQLFNFSVRNSVTSRGFGINKIAYDGVSRSYSTVATGVVPAQSIIYDRVEVLRGADGLLQGAGEPSGSINFIRKRTNGNDFNGSIGFGIGNYNQFNTNIDLNTPLTKSGNIRNRTIIEHQQRKFEKDYSKQGSNLFYTVFDADLTDDTLLSVALNWQKEKKQGITFGGIPVWYTDGSFTDFSPSKNFATKDSKAINTQKEVFINLQHNFNPDWQLDSKLTYSHLDNYTYMIQVWPGSETADGMGNLIPTLQNFKSKNFSFDNKLTGKYSLFGRQHQLVIGANFNQEKSDYVLDFGMIPKVDISNWNGNFPKQDSFGFLHTEVYDDIKQLGFFAANKFNIADNLNIYLGARLAHWKSSTTSSNLLKLSKSAFIPYVATSYEFSQNVTAYVSYTDIFNPQRKRNVDGEFITPTRGNTYETGVKTSWLDGNITANLSVFATREKNKALADGDKTVNNIPPPAGEQAYITANGVKSHGFEMDINAAINDNLNLNFAYAQWKAKHDGEAVNTQVPNKQFNLFATYQFSGVLNNLSVGGGINWSSSSYASAKRPNFGPARLEQKAFTLVNVMASYQIMQQASLQLNVDNIFNKQHKTFVGMYGHYFPGQPRTVKLNFNYMF